MANLHQQLGMQLGKHLGDDVDENGDEEKYSCASLLTKCKPDQDFPDKMTLKFEPTQVPFQLGSGEIVPLSEIDFRDYKVRPVGLLKDVWCFKNKWYPRVRLIACELEEKPEPQE